MFCPRCGVETAEGQKFCKGCGTSMQVVSDAMAGNDDPNGLGQLKIDVETLKRSAIDFGQSLKAGIASSAATGARYAGNELRAYKRREKQEPRIPKPKEWLGYSWQHNLKNGLISVFSGAGMGALFYYLGRVLIEDGTIRSIQEASGKSIAGLEHLVSLAWLLALMPVLKGLAQIIYASFFAESIATLSERFAPRLTGSPAVTEPINSAPRAAGEAASTPPVLDEPPASVTEHTTQFFEERSPAAKFERTERA
jgi:zinc ribbon protein